MPLTKTQSVATALNRMITQLPFMERGYALSVLANMTEIQDIVQKALELAKTMRGKEKV